jgi:phosphoglycolate phosphatase-like HAD superfamily hydrolase
VVLLDIDGTLLSTPVTEEGEGRRYVETIRDVVGKEPYVVPSRFAGMVDPQICKILLSEVGLSEDEVGYFLPKVLRRMAEVYVKMEKKVALNTGVTGLLAILATSPMHVTCVLTGNLRAVAEQKLTCTGIRAYCSELFCADDYFDRTSLVEDAVRTCARKYRLDSTKDVVIVGDTPRDIEAANASLATSVGIATGVYNMTQLREAGATHVFPNLEPTKELLAGLGVREEDEKR